MRSEIPLSPIHQQKGHFTASGPILTLPSQENCGNLKVRKKTANQRERPKRPDWRKQTRQGATHCCRRPRPALPNQTAKVQLAAGAPGPTKPPNRTMTSPISDLPEIPTHSPHTPAGDPKAKAQSSRTEAHCRNLQTCTQIELSVQAQHDHRSSSHTAPPICHRRPVERSCWRSKRTCRFADPQLAVRHSDRRSRFTTRPATPLWVWRDPQLESSAPWTTTKSPESVVTV